MSEPAETASSRKRRVLVALDSTAPELAALDAAAALAAELQANLEALLVEDIDLLRLAGLPFSCELDSSSADVRPLEVTSVMRALRQRAEQVRLAVEQSAARTQIQCTFQVAQGEIVRETLAASREVELFIVCRAARIAPRRERKTAPELAKVAAAPVLTVYDGSAEAGRVLAIAAQLARQLETRLIVLPVPTLEIPIKKLRERLESLPAIYQVDSVVYSVVANLNQLLHAARTNKSGWLVVGDFGPLPEPVDLPRLADRLGHPIVVVRSSLEQ